MTLTVPSDIQISIQIIQIRSRSTYDSLTPRRAWVSSIVGFI